MITNFSIKDNYALMFDTREIDLHNNFDFISCDYAIAERRLTLTWIKSQGDWVPKGEYARLRLIHHNVFFLYLGYDNKEYLYPNDDKCLSAISFFPSTERHINDNFMIQEFPREDDDILYLFEGEQSIRVGCKRVELVVESL